MSTCPRISVVIPTFNRLDQVQRCLAHVEAATTRFGNAEIIVVDNGSTDGTWEWVTQEFGGRARNLQRPGVTISALRNLGVVGATGDFVSFIDSDCLVPPDYYRSVVDVLSSVNADMVGSMYGMPENVHWIEKTWMLLNCPVREGYATLLPGGSMVVRRSRFDAVGGFDQSLVTGEDAELCQRVLDSGGKIYESPRLKLVHLRNMNSLSGFFHKQVWHSLGMFGTARSWLPDRVTLMTIAHLLLTLAALTWVAVGAASVTLRVLGAIALMAAIPIVTVAYRVLARGGAFLPFRSMVLYTVYFYARAWGLLRIAAGARGLDSGRRSVLVD
jgi:glycosyltransferase involved in cell wall biosynthesis